MAMHEFNKLKKLSDIVSMNEYQNHLEDILWEGNAMIDAGFYLEVYINPDGIDDEDSTDGESFFVFINKEITFEEFTNLKQFSHGSLRKQTMTINVIPNEDELYEDERNQSEDLE